MITKTGHLRIVIGKIPVTNIMNSMSIRNVIDLDRAKKLASQDFGGAIPKNLIVCISREDHDDHWLVTLKARNYYETRSDLS